jgi:murein DD-endopeptidase MepM/ murein hydrolase activator NlpD
MAQVPQVLLDIVKHFEGCELKAYWDRGHYSIGYGTRAKSSTEIISKEEAEKRLRDELQSSVNNVLSYVNRPLNDNQLAALASLNFNTGNIKQFPKLMAALNSGNFNEAANQFLDINKDITGNVLLGLSRRRKAERDLFLGKSSGVNYPLNSVEQTANQVGSLVQDAGSAISNGLATLQSGIQSALLTGQNCPPPLYTQQDRIIYPGCLQKTTNPIFGNGLGSGAAAPGVNAINNQANGQSQDNGSQAAEPYNGQLKPGGLIIPLKKPYTFTSKFGWRWGKMHRGVDLAASLGTPIYAAADGVVDAIHISCPVTPKYGCGAPGFGGYGNIVFLKHQGLYTLYAHLSSAAVSLGQTVKQGQVIGGVGDSGSSQGKHLHFETRLSRDNAVDPTKFIQF